MPPYGLPIRPLWPHINLITPNCSLKGPKDSNDHLLGPYGPQWAPYETLQASYGDPMDPIGHSNPPIAPYDPLWVLMTTNWSL